MTSLRYAPRKPLHAAGIRAQWSHAMPESGDIVAAEKFLSSIRTKDIGGRLAKGRRYAISGQTISLEIDGNTVRAQVVGARTQAYTVAIVFRKPDAAQAARIVTALSSSPAALAELHAGIMPVEAEAAFKAEGLDLYPGGKLAEGIYDMTTSCSCPDWANPCKHSMAVLHLLAEEIARRPATLLELRGIPFGAAGCAARSQVPFWRANSKYAKAIGSLVSMAKDKAKRLLASQRTKSRMQDGE